MVSSLTLSVSFLMSLFHTSSCLCSGDNLLMLDTPPQNLQQPPSHDTNITYHSNTPSHPTPQNLLDISGDSTQMATPHYSNSSRNTTLLNVSIDSSPTNQQLCKFILNILVYMYLCTLLMCTINYMHMYMYVLICNYMYMYTVYTAGIYLLYMYMYFIQGQFMCLCTCAYKLYVLAFR